jgi:hypothetical protein
MVFFFSLIHSIYNISHKKLFSPTNKKKRPNEQQNIGTIEENYKKKFQSNRWRHSSEPQ